MTTIIALLMTMSLTIPEEREARDDNDDIEQDDDEDDYTDGDKRRLSWW